MNRARDSPCSTTRRAGGGRIKRRRQSIDPTPRRPGAPTDRTNDDGPAAQSRRSIKSSYLVHQSRPQGTVSAADAAPSLRGPDAAPGGRLFAGLGAHTIRSRFAFRRAAVTITIEDITSGYIVVLLR